MTYQSASALVARLAARPHRADPGLEFAVGPELGILGVELNDCLDANEQPKAWAKDYIDGLVAAKTYMVVHPWGELTALIKGSWPTLRDRLLTKRYLAYAKRNYLENFDALDQAGVGCCIGKKYGVELQMWPQSVAIVAEGFIRINGRVYGASPPVVREAPAVIAVMESDFEYMVKENICFGS